MEGRVSTVLGEEEVLQPIPPKDRLRVAIISASLHIAGAEKQAYYMARSLMEAGVDVRVYSIVRGGPYMDALRELGVKCVSFGWLPGLPFRLPFLLALLLAFRPHVVQSVHAFMNVYSAVAGWILGAISIGGLRSDLGSFLADNGRFARYILQWPDVVVANSRKAVEEVKAAGLRAPSRLYFLPNVIDMSLYPERSEAVSPGDATCACICVSRLFASKRVDVFVRALAAARAEEPGVRGMVVGYGPEEDSLKELATTLGLSPDVLTFLGYREDVAAVLPQADVFVFCSESEGTPNVVLEAMAAGLPVITTPAGDAAEVVVPSGAGYLVPFGDVKATTDSILWLARSPILRQKLGKAARNHIALHAATSQLAGRLMEIYADAARTTGRGRHGNLQERLSRCPGRLERQLD